MESKQSVLSYTPAMNGKNYDGDKERTSTWSVVVRDDNEAREGGMRELIAVRVWMSRKSDGASPVYASVWIWGGDPSYSAGHGRANGYGYHKASAAIDGALRSAGVKLAQPIGGCGDSAIEGALRAIAAHPGFAQCLVLQP